jgi:hypothetical protein
MFALDSVGARRSQCGCAEHECSAMFMMSVAEQAATLDTIRKFIFSFVFRAATRLRFNLKEK